MNSELILPPEAANYSGLYLVRFGNMVSTPNLIEGIEAFEFDSALFTVHQARLGYVTNEDHKTIAWTDAFTDAESAGNYEPLDRDVLGHVSVANRWYIFHLDKIRAVDGILGQHVISDVDKEIGCPAPDSIRVLENSVFFLSKYGPRVLTGNNLQDISAPIRKYFDPKYEDCINLDEIGVSFAIMDMVNRQYKCWVPSHGSSVPDLCLAYNWEQRVWNTEDFADGTYPTALARLNDSDGLEQILIGTSDGKILKANTGNHDVFKPIAWEARFARTDFGMMVEKIVKKLTVYGQKFSELLVEYRANENDWIGNMITQGGDPYRNNSIVRVMNGRGLTYDLRLKGNDMNEPFLIKSILEEFWTTSSRGNQYD